MDRDEFACIEQKGRSVVLSATLSAAFNVCFRGTKASLPFGNHVGGKGASTNCELTHFKKVLPASSSAWLKAVLTFTIMSQAWTGNVAATSSALRHRLITPPKLRRTVSSSP